MDPIELVPEASTLCSAQKTTPLRQKCGGDMSRYASHEEGLNDSVPSSEKPEQL